MTHRMTHRKPNALFEVPLEKRRCSLPSVPLTSVAVIVKEAFTYFPST